MFRRKESLMRREYIGYTGILCHLTIDPNLSTFPVWKRVEGGSPNAKPRVTIASEVAEIEAIVENDRDYPVWLDPHGYSCLHQVCSIHSPGQVEVLRVLCSKNANVNVWDRHGRTPLHHALSPQNLEHHSKSEGGSFLLPLIEALIDFGANVNALDVHGISPFHLALDVYNSGFAGWLVTLPTILAKLIAVGADSSLTFPMPFLIPKCGTSISICSTVVHLACCMKGPASIVAVKLLVTPENVNRRDSYKSNPLHDLVNSISKSASKPVSSQGDFHLDCEEKLVISKLSLLLDLGVDVNAMDLRGGTPLWLAVQKHDSRISSEVILMLIKHGATANIRFSAKGLTPLHLLCQNLDQFAPNVLQHFLEAGGQLNAVDYKGRTPFHYAVRSSTCRISTLQQLWHAGADVTATDIEGHNALHFVCSQLDPDFGLVEFLVKLGCSIDGRNHLGETPLLLSLKSCRNQKFIEALMEIGADVRATNNRGYNALLIVCGMSRRSDTRASLIHKIIQAGADVNAADHLNRTPLMYEAITEFDEYNLETVKLLLLAGADPNIGSLEGKRPLHAACCSGNHAVAELLLEFGASVHLVDDECDTPLHCITRAYYKNPPKEQIVDIIIKRGANVNAKNLLGNTPLHCATIYGELARRKYANDQIAKRGASVTSNSNFTPLECEIGNDFCANMRTVHLLLIAGADPNVGNHDDVRPLHIAATNGNHSLTKLLLDFGADANLVNTFGHTPLHEAVASVRGNPNQTWMIMVADGANPSVKDLEGKTPLMRLSFKTYKPFMAYIAVMTSTGRYRLSEDEKGYYFNKFKYHMNELCNHFTLCLEHAHILSEVLIGPTSLAEFLLGPTSRTRQLIKNPDIAREMLLLLENPTHHMFYKFFQCKLYLLQTFNSLNDEAIKAIEFLYTKPLPRLVSEKILTHLTDLDMISLTKL